MIAASPWLGDKSSGAIGPSEMRRAALFIGESLLVLTLAIISLYATQATLMWYHELNDLDAFVRGFWYANGAISGYVACRVWHT